MTKPRLIIYEEIELVVGKETFLDSCSESNTVVFEDDGETGYFYAYDKGEDKILDALHIYDVAVVKDQHMPLRLKICRTENGSKVFLSINDYYHAVFDFKNHAGFCRNAFPLPNGPWIKNQERQLTDELILKFSIETD